MSDKQKAVLIFIFSFAVGTVLYFWLSNIRPRLSMSSSKKISRIISLSPNITETVYALGLEDKLVARSDFCDYPVKILSLPSVGNNFSIKFSKILSLKPDVILSQGASSSLKRFCKDNRIKLVILFMDSIKTIREGILKAGKALGISNKAREFVGNMDKKIKAFLVLKILKKPKVLVLLNRNPDTFSNLMTCGKKSFISEALEIAGGQNIFGDAKINYSNISLESIIRRNPDVIIEINALPGFDENMKSRMLYRWKMFSGINAVKNSKIFFIKGQRALIPGPGIVELIYKFKKMLGKTHPGDAGE